MTASPWTPPLTLEERLKRRLVPARLELARIVARELKRGEPELRLAPFLVDPRRAAVDAGANRGIWSHVLARLCPKVYAFECNPKMFTRLKAAAPAAVTCLPFGLSDAPGEARLFVPGTGQRFSNQGASLNPVKVAGVAHQEMRVETRTLDELDLEPVGFLKIDVEGHEAAVLRGAQGLIARDKPTMIIEIEERHTKRPLAHALEEICALGYRAMYLSQTGLQDAARLTPDALSPRGLPVNSFLFFPI